MATQRGLGATVFLAGIASLATEMGASRLVAPYFGSSNVVWANVIGLMLAFLALGYWLGGRVADARPDPAVLSSLLLAASVVLAVVPFVARPLLRWALEGFDALAVDVVLASFVAILLLFLVPVTLMGAVAPFAIRLAVSGVADAGRTAGRLYALSTLGSILGTFAAALLAIPLVGTQRTLIGAAVLLAAAAVPLAPARAAVVVLAAAAALAVPPGAIKRQAGVIWEGESRYGYLRVLEYADGSRAIEQNEGIAQQSVWFPNTVLTGGVWDQFQLLPALLGRPPSRILILGNAGGTVSRALARFYPRVRIDGVEIDPLVTSAARRFLGLGTTPRLQAITADARVYVETTRRRYDLIVVDAYRQPYIPFQLATREFFRLVRDRLAPGGMVAVNVAATPGDRSLSKALAATLGSVVPQVWRWRALRFNDVLFAFTAPRARGDLVRRAARVPAPLRPLVPLFRAELSPAPRAGSPWTDDRTPVEWVVDRMVARQIATGGGLEEQLLPTAP